MFQKNLDFLTPAQAEKIRHTKVAVIGAGALGQMAAHELVRSGFEILRLIDKDVVDGSNFNRQLYAANSTLNQRKVSVLKKGLMDIRPGAQISVHCDFLNGTNGKDLVEGADILLDCVDDIPTKLYLENLAEELGIPMVHGAVEGWHGQVTVIYPGDSVLPVLYQTKKAQKVSALVTTVNVIASLQVNEVIKIAIENKNILRHRVLFADLWNGDFSYIPFGDTGMDRKAVKNEQTGLKGGEGCQQNMEDIWERS